MLQTRELPPLTKQSGIQCLWHKLWGQHSFALPPQQDPMQGTWKLPGSTEWKHDDHIITLGRASAVQAQAWDWPQL
eukprot:12913048-Prorocentrum_lima.AAC.1